MLTINISLYEAFRRRTRPPSRQLVLSPSLKPSPEIQTGPGKMGSGSRFRRGIRAGSPGETHSGDLRCPKKEILIAEIPLRSTLPTIEETFRDLLQDLLGLFPDHVSEVEKLGRMEDILQSLADSFSGDLKSTLPFTQTTSNNFNRYLMPRSAN